jgi:hypothetical protein
MTTGQNIVDTARKSLLDGAKRTWSDAELLGYLNSAIGQACGTLLDIYVVVSMTGTAIGVRQTLPSGGLVLLDVPRNGNGGAVTQVALSELARTHTTWAGDASSADTNYFMFDKRSPATFLVYPPASSGTQLELVYGAVPSAIALSDTVPISPAFDTALWAYVLSMAYAKNSKKQDLAKSKEFMGLYTQVLDTWRKAKDAAGIPSDPLGAH